MPSSICWRFGIALGCSATIAVLFVYRNYLVKLAVIKKKDEGHENEEICDKKKCSVNKNVQTVETHPISELPCPRWMKVGVIKELYCYPLKSGRGKEVDYCEFTEYGIAIKTNGHLTLRDRMFLVYNEDNGKFITGRNYPTLILVSLNSVDEFNVRLEAVGMPPLIFKLPENPHSTSGYVTCTMWWNEPITCIDCGNAPAEWISKFLTGTNGGLRVGLAPAERRNILKGPWERFFKAFDKLRNDDTGLFSDLASYMLMTESSLDELNKKLSSPVPSLQFRPNIVVSGTEPFDEDNWEWIKLSDSAIIRNVKPCPRCNMTRIDPETGTVDQYEPLETLQTFREQWDPVKIAVDGKAPIFGIYCGLYRIGDVRIGDDVFVHMPKSG